MSSLATAGVAGLLLVSCAGGSGDTAGPLPAKVVDERSYLTIRPVLNRLGGPCPAVMVATMLPAMRAGAMVDCYETGAAGIDAQDLTRASATSSPTGTWEVQADLTGEAAARWRTMVTQVGAGGQVVIVVDGAMVSAPRIESTSVISPMRIVITGAADRAAAERLAQRLNHP